jgi:hypothetical protein
MSTRFSHILSQALKPSLESEEVKKVDEAPLSPTSVVQAAPEAAPTTPAKGDGEAPLSPTEIVDAKPVTTAPEGELPAATSDAADPTAAPKVDTNMVEGDVEVTLEDDGELVADVVIADDMVERGNDAVDELSRVRDSLIRTQTMVEDSLPEGGLDPSAAAFMYDNVQDKAERLNTEVTIPSVESFGAESPRYAATVAALEGIKEVAEHTGKVLKMALEKVKQFLLQLFAKLLQFGGTVSARNKALQGALTKVPANTTMKTSKIKIGAVANRIVTGSDVKVEDLAKLPKLIEGSMTYDAANDEALRKAYDQVTALAKSLEEHKGGDPMADESISKQVEALDSIFELKVPQAFQAKGEGRYETEVLPGNVSLAMVANGDVHGGPLAAAKALVRPWRVERVEHDASVPEGGEVSTASLTDVAAIIKNVAAIQAMGARVNQQKGYDKLSFQELDLSKISTVAGQAMIKAVIAAYSRRLSQVHQASAKALSYSLRVASNFQTYGFKSLEAHGKGELAAA